MTINVDFDRTELHEKDILTSSVEVKFNGSSAANMVIVDLGVPPGFEVMAEDLDKLVADRIAGSLRYYDGITHQLTFLLPKHIRSIEHKDHGIEGVLREELLDLSAV
jgi:hypothetical protein